MAEILACPFCREMYSDEECVLRCPDCDVQLLPLHELPPSAETVLEREAELERTPAEFRKLSWLDLGRGRGLLVLLALLGLFGFFQPWFVLRKPDEVVLSGFRIARHFAGWVWAGAIGWFILIPLVLSRRTIASMRGVRAICAFFASLSAGEIAVLASVSPTSKVHIPIEFGSQWGLFFSAGVSVVGTIVALRLGGPLNAAPAEAPPLSAGQRGQAQSTTALRRRRHETLH